MPNFELQAKINAWFFFGLPVVGGLVAMLLPRFGVATVPAILACYGFWLFFKAKISEKRRVRVLVSYGSRKMNVKEAKDYYTGYALMFLAIGLAIYLFSKMN